MRQGRSHSIRTSFWVVVLCASSVVLSFLKLVVWSFWMRFVSVFLWFFLLFQAVFLEFIRRCVFVFLDILAVLSWLPSRMIPMLQILGRNQVLSLIAILGRPTFPALLGGWGRLNEAGWHSARSPSWLEHGHIAVLIAVRSNFLVLFQKGMWGRSGGPQPNDNEWIDVFGRYQYFRQNCSVNAFCFVI